MMNICFLSYDFSLYGGVERVITNLANSLIDRYNVSVVSVYGKGKPEYSNISKNLKYKALNDGTGRIKDSVLDSFGKFKDYLNDNKIDVVFVIGAYCVPLALSVKYFTKTKFVFCDHGALINQIDDKKITLIRRLAAKFCDKTIALTEKTMNDYKKIFKIKDQKIDYIYNWIDEDIFKYVSDYDMGSKKIITAGRFGPEKGFDMLVDVADMVFKRHPDWTWDLFGDGEEFKKIKDLVIDKGLENNVILKGATNKIYEKYKDYAMYVLPSYREGLPLVLLEAKANRLPIVSFDVSTGPREIVRDNQDGFLIPCYNKEQMADKICTLIENPKLREQFSSRSYDNLNLFRKETVLNRWIKLIKSMC